MFLIILFFLFRSNNDKRRRLTIVLRPTWKSVMNEIKSLIDKKFTQSHKPKEDGSPEIDDQSLMKKKEHMTFQAEQLLLLALHPSAPDPPLSPIPRSSSSEPWAEPGWHINSNVPGWDLVDNLAILSSPKDHPILISNLTDCGSAPGRQASSFLTSCHLRCLTSPLTGVSKASAPAEIYPRSPPVLPQGKA